MNFERARIEKAPSAVSFESGSGAFIPQEFLDDPFSYFERHGINIKSGEIRYDEGGVIKEDPTATKEFSAWTDGEGNKLNVVMKKVNPGKGQIGKTGNSLHEYEIMQIASEFNLPAARPVANAQLNGETLIVMGKLPGFRKKGEDLRILKGSGFTSEDVDRIKTEAEELAQKLKEQYEAIGIERKWDLKDMIFDIDTEAKTLRSITPVDWERTKIDRERLIAARRGKVA